MRHRFAIRDLSLIFAATLVGLYLAYAIDFDNENGVTTGRAVIELDGALLIGGLLAVALLGFAANQYRKQRLEIVRRKAAERQARELAYQDGLTGLPNRRQFD